MSTHTCGGRGPVPCPACTVLGAQAAFVEAWRERNPVEVWGAPWLCPLCNRAVQDFYGLAAHMAQIEAHQQSHGPDWLDYAALSVLPGTRGEEVT